MSEETKTPEVKLEETMTPEELQAQTENEEFILNFSEEDSNDPDKVEKLQSLLKDAQTTIHQKRHYRTKFEEASKNAKPLGSETTPPEKKEEPKGTPASPENGIDPVKKIEFRQDHPELSKEVVTEILDYAGAKKISPEEALKSSLIQTLIEKSHRQADVDDASIAPNRAPASDLGKKDWSNATQAEVEARRNQILNGGH